MDFSVISGASSILDVFDQRRDLSVGLVQGQARGGGLTNLEVEFRYKFLSDPDDDWALAAVLGTTSRNDFKILGDSLSPTSTFQTFDASLVARKNFGRFTTNLELSWSVPLPTHNQSRFSQTVVNLACGYQLTDWLQPALELNYLHISPLSDDFETLSGTAGVIVKAADWITLYVGYQRTLLARNSDLFDTFFLGTNFTF